MNQVYYLSFFLDIPIINVATEVNKPTISNIVEPSPSKNLLGKPGGIPSPVANVRYVSCLIRSADNSNSIVHTFKITFRVFISSLLVSSIMWRLLEKS
jgi:hypothetical protein